MNPFTWTITADYQDGQQEGQPRYVLDDGMQTRTYGTVEAACAEVVECANLYADLDLCLAERRTTGVFMIGVDIQTVDDAGI